MPELPEVESVRVQIQRAGRNRRIVKATCLPDPLVFSSDHSQKVQKALQGRRITGTGRRGKYCWVELDRKPWLLFHFGMSGWVHLYDREEERPAYWKMEWVLDNGRRIAWRDPRRFGRIRLLEDPQTDARLRRLGFDPLLDLPSLPEFTRELRRRKKNLKALLLDQSFSAGVGNWIADEILYLARLSPKRLTGSLRPEETRRLRQTMKKVIEGAVKVNADSDRFPKSWLFHHRWSSRKEPLPNGRRMIRETIAGRTTAWVPDLQS